MMKAVIEKALSLVGQGYIYGAKGQRCTPEFREQQAAQYPEQADYILGTGAKWDGVPVWDCAQLTRAVAKEGGVTMPSGASSQWNKTDWAEKGTIDTIPQGKTVFVFRRQSGSSTVMQHTGVALGDGICVHARGTAYGVVSQNMSQYAWTHWGLPAEWADQDTNEEEATITMVEAKIYNIPQNETVNMRSLASKSGAVVAKIPYGTAVQAGDAVSGWRLVMWGGKTGYIMEKYLDFGNEASNQPSGGAEESVTLTIPKSAAQALYDAFLKAGWK